MSGILLLSMCKGILLLPMCPGDIVIVNVLRILLLSMCQGDIVIVNEMIGVLCHNSALVRLYWAEYNLG